MKTTIFLPCFLILLLGTCVRAQTEAQYIAALADHLNGRTEVAVTSGRADIVTAEYAIEVERAGKWKNSIGQALWYGLQTNKKAGIILLIEEPSQRKYAIQLGSAIAYAGLEDKVKVWFWPDDFPSIEPAGRLHENTPQPVAGTGEYWLNSNGNKRHTKACRWFANTKKGRYCTADEGVPAGCCH